MASVKYYSYTVEGAGVFAVDMLRYDSCWPADTESAITIDAPYHASTERLREFNQTRRQIKLTGIHEPTDARWQSFGWRVLANTIRSWR